ncbi:hypothetical protein D3C87_1782560 [compost metagenome]
MSCNTSQTAFVFCFDWIQRAHGNGLAVRDVLLQQKYRCRENNNEHTYRCGETVIPAHFTDELVEDQHWHGFVAFTNQHRGSEISQGPHEY